MLPAIKLTVSICLRGKTIERAIHFHTVQMSVGKIHQHGPVVLVERVAGVGVVHASEQDEHGPAKIHVDDAGLAQRRAGAKEKPAARVSQVQRRLMWQPWSGLARVRMGRPETLFVRNL